MAVADAFSAMTTDRPYRKGMDPEKALGVLEAGAGSQWDPIFVEAFVRARRRADREGGILRLPLPPANLPLPLAA